MRLVVQSGNQQGQVFELVRDSATIGRDARCDVMLTDTAASRNHCQIRRDPSGWVVQDLGSTNGTFVNGQRISGVHQVRPGDVIGVGKTMMRLEESPVAPPPPVAGSGMPVQAAPVGGSNTLPWLVFGGLVIVLLLIGIVVAGVMLMQPTPTPLPPPLPSPTYTATITPTQAPPTVTPLVSTPTVPTTGTTPASPKENITHTLTPTPTSTNTPTPTATPTRLFPEIFVLRPQDKAKFGQGDTIVLQWQAADYLRPMDEYYVQVSREYDFDKGLICAIRTRETQIRLPSAECSNLTFNAVYFWRVMIIAPTTNGTYIPVSPMGTIRQFGWQP